MIYTNSFFKSITRSSYLNKFDRRYLQFRDKLGKISKTGFFKKFAIDNWACLVGIVVAVDKVGKVYK
jgi:hypothetical protein